MKKLDIKKIGNLIDLAVEEDFGGGDPTSEITVSADAIDKAYLVSREEIVVGGMQVIDAVLKKYDPGLMLRMIKKDCKLVVQAAAAAQKAVDHVLGRKWEG